MPTKNNPGVLTCPRPIDYHAIVIAPIPTASDVLAAVERRRREQARQRRIIAAEEERVEQENIRERLRVAIAAKRSA